MKLGILSDTHDRRDRARRAVAMLALKGVGALVHCGDFTDPELVADLLLDGVPAFGTLGNCDEDDGSLAFAFEAIGGTWLGGGGIVELGGRRIALTHGDRPREVARLLAERPDYLFSGHTHEAADDRDGPTRRINPGALQRTSRPSVALLDLETDHLEFLPVP